MTKLTQAKSSTEAFHRGNKTCTVPAQYMFSLLRMKLLEEAKENQMITTAFMRTMNLSSKNKNKTEETFLTQEETEDISVTWDYLVGHVGLKVTAIVLQFERVFSDNSKRDYSRSLRLQRECIFTTK